jgi:hypothetical protein
MRYVTSEEMTIEDKTREEKIGELKRLEKC